MNKKYIIAFDIGTTGCRTILFGQQGQMIDSAYREFTQIYPKPGWVEHNPMEIWNMQLQTAREVFQRVGVIQEEIAAIGITNQRETTVVWDKQTGIPLMNAIVWQDRRTCDICEELEDKGWAEYVSRTTGLRIDPYFSATKIKWILDNIPNARQKAERGDILFGTIDTWIIWKLTGGKAHVTDYSNASRTMIFDINNLCWDEKLLKELEIPVQILPQVRPSGEIYANTDEKEFLGIRIPVAASIGDQQGALFGQACFESGMVKATYGTGGSLLMNTGEKRILSQHEMLSSIAWGMNGKVQYTLEGLLYVVGASIQWLRDELQLIKCADQTEEMAFSVPDTNGAYFVPAFVGLSAPYWDSYARGGILGLTRGVNKNHIVRAALESIAYQIKDVLICMEQDSNISITQLKVDGGACKNNFLMQFQADLLDVPVLRPKMVDATARGAAFLAGLATEFWKDQRELIHTFELDREYLPKMKEQERNELYQGWQKAVSRTVNWIKH